MHSIAAAAGGQPGGGICKKYRSDRREAEQSEQER